MPSKKILIQASQIISISNKLVARSPKKDKEDLLNKKYF